MSFWCDSEDDVDLLFPESLDDWEEEEPVEIVREEPLSVGEKNFLLYLIKYGSLSDEQLPSMPLGVVDPLVEVVESLVRRGYIDRGRDGSWNSVSVLSNKFVNLLWDRF